MAGWPEKMVKEAICNMEILGHHKFDPESSMLESEEIRTSVLV